MASSASPEPTLIDHRRRRFMPSCSLSELWSAEVDTARCTFQMNCYYLMSGLVNAISFSAIFVWCGFQSGNTVQLAIAIARIWENRGEGFMIADKQALASLTTFILGALVVRFCEMFFRPKSRGWMWLGTMLSAALTMASAIASLKSDQGYPGISDDRYSIGPAWSDAVSFLALIFMSMSMGVQGLMSLRLKTNSGATLPLTTTWVELCGVEALFKVNQLDTARDQRMIGIASVLLGALAGRGLTFRLGSPGALGVAAGIRVVIAFSWIFVPSSEEYESHRRSVIESSEKTSSSVNPEPAIPV